MRTQLYEYPFPGTKSKDQKDAEDANCVEKGKTNDLPKEPLAWKEERLKRKR